MISYRAIRSVLRAHLLSLPNLPDAAWENRSFTPTLGTPWMRETLLPADERQTASDTLQALGLTQFDVVYPADSGTETAEDMADTIKHHFRPPQVVGGVVIERADRLPGRIDGAWYMVPIRIHWRAHSVG